MCRALVAGGRRCPCSDPRKRSVRRRGPNAANRAAAAVIGHGGSGTGAVSVDEPQTWADDLTEIRHLCGTVAVFNQKPNDHATHLDNHVAAALWLQSEGFGTGADQPYRVAVHVGDMVAGEAEKRAGVTAAEARAAYTARREQAIRVVEEVTARTDAHIKTTFTLPQEQLRRRREEAHTEVEALRGELTDEQVRGTEQWREYLQLRDQEIELSLQRTLYQRNEGKVDPELSRLAAGGLDTEARQHLTKLSEAYLEVLSEIRPMGGEFAWHSKATKKARDAFGGVAQLFPTEWIDKSNLNQSALLPKMGTSRAHYRHGHLEVSKQKQRAHRIYLYNSEDAIPKDSVWETHEVAGVDTDSGSVRVKKLLWDVRRTYGDLDETNPPRGKGWEVWTDPNNPERRLWRRPQHKMVAVKQENVSEVTTNADSYRVGVDHLHGPAATSAHELGHRMQYTVNGITQIENRFLQERAGDDKPVALYGGRRHRGHLELSRPDKFVDAYIGKMYEGPATEVLSMGMESLFAGSHGGLVGVGNYDPDLHMRSTILGTLATVTDRDAYIHDAPKPASEEEKEERRRSVAATKGVYVSAAAHR